MRLNSGAAGVLAVIASGSPVGAVILAWLIAGIPPIPGYLITSGGLLFMCAAAACRL